MLTLPECRWRRPFSKDRYICKSTKLIVGPNGVSEKTCLVCPYANHEPTSATNPHYQKPIPTHGPGTELTNVLESLGANTNDGCNGGCRALALKMNEWGITGCREHADEIITQLRENYKKLGWAERFKIAANAFTSKLGWQMDDWSDPAPWLLDEAIRRTLTKQ